MQEDTTSSVMPVMEQARYSSKERTFEAVRTGQDYDTCNNASKNASREHVVESTMMIPGVRPREHPGTDSFETF